jgi:hypothetical protein
LATTHELKHKVDVHGILEHLLQVHNIEGFTELKVGINFAPHFPLVAAQARASQMLSEFWD